MTAEGKFWDALSFLLRPGDATHNTAMIRDFAKASGIAEQTIREKLNQILDGARQ